MVLGMPKLFTRSSSGGSGGVARHQAYYPDYNDDGDDNTIGDDTVGSDTKSILRRYGGRRGSKRNTERNVSWSHTFDTYEEGGVEVAGTFETLDTIQQSREEDGGGGGVYDAFEERVNDLVDNSLIRGFNSIYPGETDMSYDGRTQSYSRSQTYSHDDDFANDTLQSAVSVNSDIDGTVELELGYTDSRSMEDLEPRLKNPVAVLMAGMSMSSSMPMPPPPPPITPLSVERKQLAPMVSSEELARPKTPGSISMPSSISMQPPPPPMMAPMPEKRKRLMPTFFSLPRMATKQESQEQPRAPFRNLACASTTSEATAEELKDRYGGLNEGNSENIMHAFMPPNPNLPRSSSNTVINQCSATEDVKVMKKSDAPGEKNNQTIQQKEAVSFAGIKSHEKATTETSGIFIPKESEFPDEVSEADSRSVCSLISALDDKDVPVLKKSATPDVEKNQTNHQEESIVAKPSGVFIPKDIELPDKISEGLTHNDSLSLDSVLGNNADEVDEGLAHSDSFTLDSVLYDNISFDDIPNVDMTRARAGSDESLVTLSKKDHEYEPIFKNQKKADVSAGHIGLILPFLGKIKWNPLSMDSTMFESWDVDALKKDLMRSAPPYPTAKEQVKSNGSSPVVLNDASGLSEARDDADTLARPCAKGEETRPSSNAVSSSDSSHSEGKDKSQPNIDDREENESWDGSYHNVKSLISDDSSSIDDGVDSSLSAKNTDSSADEVSKLSPKYSTSNDGMDLEPKKSNPNDGKVTENPLESITKSINEFDIKGFLGLQAPNDSAPNNVDISDQTTEVGISNDAEESESNSGPAEEFDIADKGLQESSNNNGDDSSEGDVPSDASTEVNSAELESEDESEPSVQGVPVGEVISIKELNRPKMSKKREKKKTKKNRRNKKNKEEDSGSLQPLQVILMDQTTMDILDQNTRFEGQRLRGKKRLWVWKKKQKYSSSRASSPHVRDRFQPILLPPGRVHEENDDEGSCITTESILSELKVIENTAKLMYQKMVVGDGDLGPSHNDISALFSPTETELVLDPKWEPAGDQGQNEPSENQQQEGTAEVSTKKKRGGKIWKLIGRVFPKKKRRFGPILGVSGVWTPNAEL